MCDVREHQLHGNNFVVTVKRTGTTSDGYVMEHGTESQQWNGNAAHMSLNDTRENAEGSEFKALLKVVFEPEGPQLEQLRLRGIRP